MKYKLKFGSFSNSRNIEVYKKPFFFLQKFCSNVKKCFLVMNPIEKIVFLALVSTAFVGILIGGYKSYIARTVLVPLNKGTYTEAIVGDIKYLNPELSQNDAEKSVSSLLFSGLLKVNEKNELVTDLAARYEISEDERTYTFYLRKDATFSNGTPVTASDISYSVDLIKTPELKSPMLNSFKDVETQIIDDYTITFTLPKAYGPFAYNCTFGIIPSELSSDEFSKTFVGSGPYKFVKFTKKDNKVKEVELARNESYYGVKPNLDKVNFKVYTTADEAKNAFSSDKGQSGLFGARGSVGNDYSFSSAREMGLIFNLRSKKLTDKNIRQQIIEGQKLANNLTLSLSALDMPLQHQKAEEIKQKSADQNVTIEIQYLSAVKFQETLQNKNYDLILYGFDFGYDRDPYVYWHSSQLEALNLAGYSNKNSDILLEDARMIVDPVQRNQKYDQFFESIKSEYLATFYYQIKMDFFVKAEVKGVSPVLGIQPSARFSQISSWYTMEKRVRR